MYYDEIEGKWKKFGTSPVKNAYWVFFEGESAENLDPKLKDFIIMGSKKSVIEDFEGVINFINGAKSE
jgi:hypothetical protein